MNATSPDRSLGEKSLPRLMAKYAVPCIISLLVAALYNIVDQIFIANAPYLGSFGNAANTVVFPLTVIALAIAVMIGDGCCAFVSLSLGKNQPKDAGKAVGNAVTLSVVSGLLLCAIYLVFLKPCVLLFGAAVNEKTLEFSLEYFFYIALGIPFYVFGQAMNPVIRADGSPNFAMASTLAGAALNLVLDPLFIFGFHWGMMGAAVATVLGQVLTAALAVYYLFHMKAVKLSKSCFLLSGAITRRFLCLGICSFLAQISLVAAMAATNNMIQKYGRIDAVFGQSKFSQIPMAVFGIVMKYYQIIVSVSIGMAAGCIPIVGFNMGAGNRRRVKKLFMMLLSCEFLVGLLALAVVFLFPKELIGIFGAQNESYHYTAFAVRVFRVYLCMLPLSLLNKGTFIFLQAMGKAAASTLLSMSREVLFGVGFVLLLPRFFALEGVLYSMPAADLLAFVASVSVIIYTFKRLSEEKTEIRNQTAEA